MVLEGHYKNNKQPLMGKIPDLLQSTVTDLPVILLSFVCIFSMFCVQSAPGFIFCAACPMLVYFQTSLWGSLTLYSAPSPSTHGHNPVSATNVAKLSVDFTPCPQAKCSKCDTSAYATESLGKRKAGGLVAPVLLTPEIAQCLSGYTPGFYNLHPGCKDFKSPWGKRSAYPS